MAWQQLYVVLLLLVFFGRIHGIDLLEGNSLRYRCMKGRYINKCNETFLEDYNSSKLAESDSNINPADTWFLLFTRENNVQPEYLNECGKCLPSNTLYNGKLNTVIIVHGFLEGPCQAAWQLEMKEQLLFRDSYNVILVDWTWGNGPDYYGAAKNVMVVGKQIALFICNLLNCTGASSENFHCVGHSLGAQIAGIAGYTLQKLCGAKMRRITGLDPAKPAVYGNPTESRLDVSDAKIVDILHTNAGGCTDFGYPGNIGTADFYPNNGAVQLSCVPYTLISFLKGDIFYATLSLIPQFCFHKQSVQYFKVSINACNCQFIGVECDSYEDFHCGKCKSCGADGSNCAVMGMDYEYYVTKPGNHSYYLDTTLCCPYCDNSKIDQQGFPTSPPNGNPPKCFPNGTA